jgi:hypothetical protein
MIASGFSMIAWIIPKLGGINQYRVFLSAALDVLGLKTSVLPTSKCHTQMCFVH